MEQEPLRIWTRALVELTGWDRITYGSEFPVALWRDETYRSTQSWIDGAALDLPPWSAGSSSARMRANASSKRAGRRLIDAKWQRTDWKTDSPVWLFQKKGIDFARESHRRILRAYPV